MFPLKKGHSEKTEKGKNMKPYIKANLVFLPREKQDILTDSSPLGVHDAPSDSDDTGYAGYARTDR